MRRWNGWGDEATTYPFPHPAARHLETIIGESRHIPDAPIERILARVTSSYLAPQPGLITDPAERLHHAHGQSLPDWVAMRHGCIDVFPDAVIYPSSDDDVRSCFELARRSGARLIPYGGGTSVVGHVNPRSQDAPVITLDLSRMNRLLDLDETSGLATFEAGAAGPEIERQLAARGYTLGHFPQSWELSTLGGWVATRSSGQQSYHYGRIEDLFAGGHAETPVGACDFPPLPASAAGPDLRQVILGSEGRFGILTRAIVRVKRASDVDRFYGVFFHDWQSGANAVREIAQKGTAVSMLRLSDADETEITLRLAGKERTIGLLKRGLNLVGFKTARSLMILGITGDPDTAELAYQQAAAIWRKHGALATGQGIGNAWKKGRFLTPYLRNTLWDRGYAADTLETALPWVGVDRCATQLKRVIGEAMATFGERVLVFTHLSHVYADGASIYVTYLWRRSHDPGETLAHWKAMKDAAGKAVIASGGTISHQHGVGTDHARYLTAEKGETGMRILEAIGRSLDPNGIMNPGKLID